MRSACTSVCCLGGQQLEQPGQHAREVLVTNAMVARSVEVLQEEFGCRPVAVFAQQVGVRVRQPARLPPLEPVAPRALVVVERRASQPVDFREMAADRLFDGGTRLGNRGLHGVTVAARPPFQRSSA